jgi:hypothetical protein
MRKMPLYKAIAMTLDAYNRCIETKNTEWEEKHYETLAKLNSYLPSGSGIDNGTELDEEKSSSEKLVFHFGFHHMNEGGMYDGWTQHTLTVKPSLYFDIELKISGPNRNDIKEYLHETYHAALTEEVEL